MRREFARTPFCIYWYISHRCRRFILLEIIGYVLYTIKVSKLNGVIAFFFRRIGLTQFCPGSYFSINRRQTWD